MMTAPPPTLTANSLLKKCGPAALGRVLTAKNVGLMSVQ